MEKREQRRKLILDMLAQNPIATVGELSESLSVTMETIRKDLSALADQGLVVRIHGGAALADNAPAVEPFKERENVDTLVKKKIAKAACQLIEPGESLILEGCTTNVELCLELLLNPELLQTLVIVTNSGRILQLLDMGTRCARLFFLGGWVRKSEGSCQGQYTANSLQIFHVSKAFISGAALDKNLNVFAFREDDMRFQQQAAKNAETVCLLVNGSKYPKSALFSVFSATQANYLITDLVFNPRSFEELKAAQTCLIKV